MPRTREFDPEKALDAAMKVFWTKGFVETSYDDLVRGTGVSRKGLYTAFGDKHGLFVTAMAHYRKTIIPQFFAALDAEDVSADSIRAMFRSFVEQSDRAVGQRGCLISRTSSDEIIEVPDIKSIIDEHWAEMHGRFFNALVRAGYSEARAERLAPYFLGVLQGFLSLAHARAGKHLIGPFIEEALTALD